jgi:hypothetical protein
MRICYSVLGARIDHVRTCPQPKSLTEKENDSCCCYRGKGKTITGSRLDNVFQTQTVAFK